MAEMTIAPVATHGFFVDGRWQQEGDLVEATGEEWALDEMEAEDVELSEDD